MNRGLLALFAFLLLVCALVQAARTSVLYFTGQDDIYMGVLADKVRTEGIRPYLEYAGGYASRQGRAYFYFNFLFFIAPYLTNSALVRTFMITAAQLAAIGVMGAFLSLYLTRIGGALFVAGTLCLLPYWPSDYPTTANMVVYQMPVLLFFGGMSLYVAQARGVGIAGRYPRLFRVVAMALLLASLFIYEAVVVPFALIAIAIVWAEGGPRKLLPFGALFCAWALMYAAYRLFHPPWYGGVTLAPFDPGLFTWDVWRHVMKSLPGANSVVNFAWPEMRSPGGFLRYLRLQLGLGGLAETLAVTALIGVALLRRREEAGPRGITLVVALALVSAVLVPMPLVLTTKYRNMPWDAMPYLPGYYTFLACMAAVTAAMVGLYRLASRRARAVAAAALALLFAVFTATGSVANDQVTGAYAKDSRKWKLVDLLCATDILRKLPPDSVVLAPTLWDGIDPEWWYVEDYWTRYVHIKLGRKIQFVRTREEAAAFGHVPLFYCEHQWSPGTAASALLLMHLMTDDLRKPTGDAVTVISDRDLPDSELEYVTTKADPPARCRIPRLAFEDGAFVGALPTPGMVAGSARLVSQKAVRPAAWIPVEFEQGFSSMERRDTHYWRWSNGASGEGLLALVNDSNKPMRVVFRTALMTGGNKKKTKFDVTIQGRRDTLEAVDLQVYERELTLDPGRTEIAIKCYGPRVDAPGDPRYIVFGLAGWSVTPKP